MSTLKISSPWHSWNIAESGVKHKKKSLKNLDNYEEDDDDIEIDRAYVNNPIYDEILNCEITEKEIIDALKVLKNSKSPGLENLSSEYLKIEYIHVFKNIFNLVLDSGIIPDSSTIDIIKPIYIGIKVMWRILTTSVLLPC
jgi:hypothetical protein